MVEKSAENIGQVKQVLADKGYHSGRELKACQELGVATFVSPKESSSVKRILILQWKLLSMIIRRTPTLAQLM